MSEGVRMGRGWAASVQNSPYISGADPSTALVNEECFFAVVGFEVRSQCNYCRAAERHYPLLVSLAPNSDCGGVEV